LAFSAEKGNIVPYPRRKLII